MGGSTRPIRREAVGTAASKEPSDSDGPLKCGYGLQAAPLAGQ